MPLCTDRARRPNAGSKMAKLLNEEDEDEFYTSVYGGFTEEAEDLDYESESSIEDIIDSDFDDDSESGDDDAASDESDENEKRKSRSRRVVTKGYKEPKRAKASATAKEASTTDTSTAPPAKAARTTEKSGTSRSAAAAADASINLEPRTLRRSTLKATATVDAEAERRRLSSSKNTAVRREAMLAEIAQRKNVPEVRRLTQEELLAEAKVTEEINRRSLARYQRLEIEKKKARIQKTVHSTPMVRYHSFTVPDMEEQPEMYGVTMDTDASTIRAGPIIANREARCSRNLITFADLEVMRAAMPRTMTPLPEPGVVAPAPPQRPRRRNRICPITGLPAPYMDPITLTPYANLAAFRVLRRLYAIHLETNAAPIDLLREYRRGNIAVDQTC